MKVNTCLISGLVGLATISFLSLTSSFVSADSVVTTTTINVPESCTMSGTGMTSHAATLINGTYSGTDYSNGIGTTTLKVFCNDSAGFAIYAIGYTNDEYGNTKLHWDGVSSASDTTHDIDTGIYTSGSTTDSTWSMKLSAISGTYSATIDDGNSSHNNSAEDFTNWHEVPDEYERVAYKLSGTDLDTNNNGTGSSITTTYDAYISQTQPAGTYIGQVKYTLVHPATHAAPVTEYIMQEVASWKDDLSIGDEIQAKDARDNKVYYVAKLADGNIWMTQNLDHDIDSSYDYNSANTDVPSSWSDTLTDTYATNITTWNNSNTAPESYDPGNLCWTGNLNTDFDGTLVTETEPCTQNGNHYHIGNYYDWTAAVAMSDSSSYTTPDTDVNQSICPAGWMLPKSGPTRTGSGSFINLLTEYDWNESTYVFTGSYTALGEPLNLALDGAWGGYSAWVATSGLFWSSVVDDDGNAYILCGEMDYFVPQTHTDRNAGVSVRCVARP